MRPPECSALAEALAVEGSEILRDALHRRLVALSSEHDAEAWERIPLDDGERSLAAVADWGLAEELVGLARCSAVRMRCRSPAAITWSSLATRGRPDRRRRIVAALTRTRRGLVSEVLLGAGEDGASSNCFGRLRRVLHAAAVKPSVEQDHRRCLAADRASVPRPAQRGGVLIESQSSRASWAHRRPGQEVALEFAPTVSTDSKGANRREFAVRAGGPGHRVPIGQPAATIPGPGEAVVTGVGVASSPKRYAVVGGCRVSGLSRGSDRLRSDPQGEGP